MKVYRGDALLRTERFERDVIKIGTLASAHLRLEEEAEVARVHAVIEVAPDGRVAVVDMGGAAGTFLNGRRLLNEPEKLPTSGPPGPAKVYWPGAG